MVDFVRKYPATLSLIVVNGIVFLWMYLMVGTLEEPAWTLNSLQHGALFNPYTLKDEWYRILTSMFMHGHLLHLAVNMSALLFTGSELEEVVGTSKFLWVYFITGIAASFSSLYWNLFTIGVGASGALFGLFGFSIVLHIYYNRQQRLPITPVLVSFTVFLIVNTIFSQALNGDHAAHFGGLAAGVALALFSLFLTKSFHRIAVEYAFLILLILLFFAMPRYQVRYFDFYQQVLVAEDSANSIFDKKNISDEAFANAFKKNTLQWDSALTSLNAQSYIPGELQSDTFKLRRYLNLRRLENIFRVSMIERESYIYLDSIERMQDSVKHYISLDYALSVAHVRVKKEEPEPDETPPMEMTKVWYDHNWEEIPGPPASYYRIGFRDSLGRWQGAVRDYYISGAIQMKGTYKDDKRDGVFLYYSDHNTYTSAGRYRNNRSIGKWETYHTNGRLASEVYYTDRYFLKNLWDSTGHQWVKDGEGKEIQRYPNGIVAAEGAYRDGYKEGYWYGRHENGEMYFEESYHQGRLVHGRSRSLKGESVVYDATSEYPLPEGGYKKLNAYLREEAGKVNSTRKGTVRLSFRVTTDKVLADIEVESSVSPELDEKAKEILRNGPAWIPAREHGQKAVEGYSVVSIDF
jgi:membrane associated rhomboid family serine protease/antitoxin component YwqK of YwqJK toxin-antitoxin module